MNLESDLEQAVDTHFLRKRREACSETRALVLGTEETAVSGTHCKSLSRAGHHGLCAMNQALCTRVREWKSSTFWTALCDVWMVLCLNPCGGCCVSISCQTQRK